VLVLGLATYGALAGSALAVSAGLFEFTDVAEILPNGESFPLVPADELWPLLREALHAPLLPLAAAAGVGFLAGSLLRSAAGALACSLGAMLFLDLVRTVARGFDYEAWLHTAYLSSPLGDTSFLKFYADAAQGVSNASFTFRDTALLVPLLWCVVTFGLASLVLARRSVP
jgi:hypothetical protein